MVQLSGQRFLVTGGGGFIGRYVVEQLLARGATVRIFDLPGRADRFQGHPSIEVLTGDLRRPEDVRRAVDGTTGVFHMAVLALNPSTENPRLCLEVNVDGSFNVFEAAQQAGVQKVVFSSASSVYGDTLEVMDESHPLHARTIYGASKIAGEAMLRALCTAGSQGAPQGSANQYVTLRYMNVYGPFMGFGLVDSVLTRIASGRAPVINGDGSQSFDFVYVSDVAGATVRAMESDVTDEVLNVGSGEERTVRDVVFALLELTETPLQPEFRDVQVPMVRRVGSSEK
ncbi:MAG: NAD-dependent epimerase/dehydratase family protein, partial [Chloroflexota bacterium]|nr:NAD-dependent epimerase/dehydratase family protein [Chloroflexota bacterium]